MKEIVSKKWLTRFSLIVGLLAPATAISAQTVDGRNFGIDGFAAYAGIPGTNHYLAGGTTGGQGGKVVKADNFAQLQAYLQSSKPYIVLVDHDITTGITAYVDALTTGKLCDKQDGSEGVPTTYGERIMISPNKTLIGVADANGNAPLFSRITFVMQCCSNVIIRNCRFTMAGVPILKSGENKVVAWRNGQQKEVGDPDCIGIQADNNSAKTDWGAHFWIDHCEFFNGDAANKDRYDGLVDCKNNVQWLTISYNLFHDHDKACLWGKGDSDVFDGCRTISAHHNYFKNIQGSRLPLQRGGHVHYMNNYQVKAQDGWDLRNKSVGYADACYFKDSKAPILPDGGGVLNINNADGFGIIYDNCQRVITGHSGISYVNTPSKYDKEFPASSYVTSTWKPTDTWENYYVNSHDLAADVPAVCEQYAGAGKIVVWNSYATAIPEASDADYAEACASQQTSACYDANGNKVSDVSGGGSDQGSGSTVSDDASNYFTGADDDGWFWFNATNELEINGWIAANDLVMTTGTNGAVSSFNKDVTPKSDKDANLVSDKTGALVIAKAGSKGGSDGGSAIFHCAKGIENFQLYLFRTGSYNYHVYVSTDGSKYNDVITNTSSNSGKLVIDYSSQLKTADPVWVKVQNSSTGGLNIHGIILTHIDDGTTGINNINVDLNDNANVYDLMGRRVDAPKAGKVYIKGGKKFIMR